MPKIIYFFHPGKEHGYDKNCSQNGVLLKDWNCGEHRRKFLLNEGSYIKNGKKYKGKLLFWGEWEPPSEVKKLQSNSSQPENPKYLHIPFLPTDEQIKKYQKKIGKTSQCKKSCCRDAESCCRDTDPFVFGKSFIYEICLQRHFTSLRNLEKGSLIIFGSHLNKRFVIDTVFVVKNVKEHYSFEDVIKMNLGKYPEIATKFIIANSNNKFTLYTGATYEDQVNGMYSFVPAKVYDGQEKGFPRISLPKSSIHEKQNMGIAKKDNASEKDISDLWRDIKKEVSKNHVLGINFKFPSSKISVSKKIIGNSL
jgi:hypothetical protein